jgi:hypothetical protein
MLGMTRLYYIQKKFFLGRLVGVHSNPESDFSPVTFMLN